MIGELKNYLKQRVPHTWMISASDSGSMVVCDTSITKGKGYTVTIHESLSGYKACIEFQDFAKDISSYAELQLENRQHPIGRLIESNINVICKRYRRLVEDIFKNETAESDGWWLVIDYRLPNRDLNETEKFADLLVSFLLFLFPYDMEAEEEGTPQESFTTKYERSRVNRSICLAFHGYRCKACGINLKEQYGEVARQFIHVHHLNLVSQSGVTTHDPINNMVPLCPNCHGIAHRRTPPFTVQEIREMIIKNNGKLFS